MPTKPKGMKLRNIILVMILTVAFVLIAELTKPLRPPGFIRLRNPQVHMKLHYGLWGKRIDPSTGPIQIPAGQYRPTAVWLEEGHFTLSCDESWGRLKPIIVRVGQITELDPGPPLEARMNVNVSSEEVSIFFNLVGKMEEHYNPWAEKTGSALPAPSFRITDEQGRLLHSDTFGFG